MFEPKATASHLDSTRLRRAAGAQECLLIGVDGKLSAESQTDAIDPYETCCKSHSINSSAATQYCWQPSFYADAKVG